MKDFFKLAAALGHPKDEADKKRRVHETKMHNELAPWKAEAGEMATHLEGVINSKIRQVVDGVGAANVQDSVIGDLLFKLQSLTDVPNQLRHAIRDAEKVTFDDFRQTVNPELVNEQKRGALLRELRQRLLAGRGIERHAKSLVLQINQRLQNLANAQLINPDAPSANIKIPKAEAEIDRWIVTSNFDARTMPSAVNVRG